MAELPQNWQLTTDRRSDGGLDVVGVDDAGERYKVRSCGGEITDADLASISMNDREIYANKAQGARQVVRGLLQQGERLKESRDNDFYEELVELSGPAVRAGFEMERSRTGACGLRKSATFSANWQRAFGGD